MTEIRLVNRITLDHAEELVEETYIGEIRQKEGVLYLTYHNRDHERVLIKCEAKRLHMTRFSNPHMQLHFSASKDGLAIMPTPMGVQHFRTHTKHYSCNPDSQPITLSYDLMPLEGEEAFASYDLQIFWGDE